MSSKAGCSFSAAHALKIPATKVSSGNFGKASEWCRGRQGMRGIPRRLCAEIPATKISSRNFGNASGGVEEGKAAVRAPIRSRPNVSYLSPGP